MAQLPFSFSGRPIAEKPAERPRPGRPAGPEEKPASPRPDGARRELPPPSSPPETNAQGPRPPERRAPERTAPERPVVYTVSELQTRLRDELEARYLVVYVAGEISNYHLNTRSGHAYFTLKDADAQLKCVLFRDQLLRLRFRPGDGLEVVVRGKITIYEQGGQLQLIAQHLEPKGLGARQLELQQRIEKLKKEGLTSDARKRRLPAFPRTIGVVTSKSGAALRDVLRTILRRDPFAHVILSTTAVQGDGAALQIAEALRRLDALRRCDVIILARGGGSIEDLWCFNEEPVARAIVACSVPVVTGVGHETDTTIADLVADLRASTPTAAAEHVVPVRSEVRARVQKLEAALHRALHHRVQREGRRLLTLSGRLKHPEGMIERRAQRIDELSTRGERAMRQHLARSLDRLARLERRLTRRDPKAELKRVESRLQGLEARLGHALHRRLDREGHALAVLVGRLESLSPLAVLARGYSLAYSPSGALLRRAADVSPGERLVLRLAEGHVEAEVTAVDRLDPRGDAPKP